MPCLIDTHCHLQDERLAPDLSGVLARARKAEVRLMICCATEPADWDHVAEIVRNNPGRVLPCFGVHPWYVHNVANDYSEKLKCMLLGQPSAMGEIGLDFAINECDRTLQETIFLEQIGMAHALNLPVSIHCRRAWPRMLEILGYEGKGLRGLIHSYSGGPEHVAALAKLGWHFSFSGTITRKRNKRGHRALQTVPDELLLIETDSPDLIPVGPEGDLNEPSNLPFVVKAVAALKHIQMEEAAQLTSENAKRLFAAVNPPSRVEAT